MPNPNPIQARLAKRRYRKRGDIQEISRKCWNAVLHIEAVLESEATKEVPNIEIVLRAAHLQAITTQAYAKLLDAGDFETRLKELERAVYAHSDPTTQTHGNGLGRRSATAR